jgi:hypothetical protein
MEFKDWNKAGELIQQSYNFLSKKGLKLSGGNCGQVAQAIYFFLEDNNLPIKIGLITDVEEEADLLEGEPDIYHVYVISNNQRYDEEGPITWKYLQKLAGDEYGDYEPSEFIFDNLEKVAQIISRETNWNRDHGFFYGLLKKQSLATLAKYQPGTARARIPASFQRREITQKQKHVEKEPPENKLKNQS